MECIWFPCWGLGFDQSVLVTFFGPLRIWTILFNSGAFLNYATWRDSNPSYAISGKAMQVTIEKPRASHRAAFGIEVEMTCDLASKPDHSSIYSMFQSSLNQWLAGFICESCAWRSIWGKVASRTLSWSKYCWSISIAASEGWESCQLYQVPKTRPNKTKQ